MSTLLACVCQLPSGLVAGGRAWDGLRQRLQRLGPDLLVLNEMPWGPWIASVPEPDDSRFDALCRQSEEGVATLADLGVPVVAGSRPVRRDSRRLNEAFLWSAADGYRAVHAKHYFPQEPGFYEASWFDGGDPPFRLAEAGGLQVGFLLCTELMFNEHARRHGRQGAHLVLVPRATERASVARWRVAAQMAAMVSGCWVLSSNRDGQVAGEPDFGGAGWVIDPTGTCVAETSLEVPVVSVLLDPEASRRRQAGYPCYVAEMA